jgi:hypothetical protein
MRVAPIVFAAACLGLTAAVLAGCGDRGSIVREVSPEIPQAARPVDGKPAFVGVWAAARSECGHAAWTMTPQRLQSPATVRCAIGTATPTLAGYTLHSSCSSGGVDMPGRIVVTMNGGSPAQGMTLQGGPFTEPVSLVRCAT